MAGKSPPTRPGRTSRPVIEISRKVRLPGVVLPRSRLSVIATTSAENTGCVRNHRDILTRDAATRLILAARSNNDRSIGTSGVVDGVQKPIRHREQGDKYANDTGHSNHHHHRTPKPL